MRKRRVRRKAVGTRAPTRECLLAMPETSISGRRVARELAILIERRGKLGMIVSDNGTKLTSNAILTFCAMQKLNWHYIAPIQDTKRLRGKFQWMYE